MMPTFLALIFLLGAWSNGAAQQHAWRPVKPPDTRPVTVMRSAILQVFVDSDAVSVFSYLSDQRKLTAWFAGQASWIRSLEANAISAGRTRNP